MFAGNFLHRLGGSKPRACVRIAGLAVLSTFLCACAGSGQGAAPSESAPASADSALRSWLQTNTAAVRSTDPNAGDFSDLAAFGAALGDARIVLLDEQTHGDGNVFSLKARLVRYLHEQKGFDVLVLESGLFDVDRIWQRAQQGRSIRAQAPGSIFFMYARSAEVAPLFEYLDSKLASGSPLALAGMDSQHTGEISQRELINDLQALLLSVGSALPGQASWQRFSDLGNTLMRLDRTAPTAADQALFFDTLDRARADLEGARNASELSTEAVGLWSRLLVSLDNQARRYWGLANDSTRSVAMGENVNWLAHTRYPKAKLIVWGHAVHLGRRARILENNAGQTIVEHFGDRVYAVHFTGFQGAYLDFNSLAVVPIPAPGSSSVEAIWHRTAAPAGFASWRALPASAASASATQQMSDYGAPVPTREWPALWDGTFFVDTITPANPVH